MVWSGSKAFTFLVQYEIEGRSRKFTIGKSSFMPLADARTAAKGILARVAAGEDPQAQKKAARQAAPTMTLGELVPAFIAAKSGGNRPLRAKTVGEYRRYLETDAAALRRRPLNAITDDDVARLISTVKVNRPEFAGGSNS
jgi:hypothetical protein